MLSISIKVNRKSWSLSYSHLILHVVISSALVIQNISCCDAIAAIKYCLLFQQPWLSTDPQAAMHFDTELLCRNIFGFE